MLKSFNGCPILRIGYVASVIILCGLITQNCFVGCATGSYETERKYPDGIVQTRRMKVSVPTTEGMNLVRDITSRVAELTDGAIYGISGGTGVLGGLIGWLWGRHKGWDEKTQDLGSGLTSNIGVASLMRTRRTSPGKTKGKKR